METLRYADEVRQGQSFFSEIGAEKPDEDLLDLATTLIDKKTAPFDAKQFEDHYADALMRLIERKAKAKNGTKILEDAEEPESGRRGSNVVDLMAALKKSVGDAKPPASSAPKRRAASADKEPAAKDAKPAAKAPAKRAPARAPRAKKSA